MPDLTQNSSEYILRQASAEDARAIRQLIRAVRINPLGLDWRRFVVAISADGHLIGCGQVKLHARGVQELASIAVKRGWRRGGVARAIIQRLMSTYSGALYLTCRARLGKFYEKFGFQRVDRATMPPYFRRIERLAGLLKALRLLNEDLWVMRVGN